MSLFDRDKSSERLPVALITGFLGSGKTTLLNRVLGDPRMARSLVLVNEFGEIGLDHLFMEHVDGDMVLLQSGCVCCTIQGESQPLVIHGVHHTFHPPTLLARWPDAERRSRLVFITRDLDRKSVEESWEQMMEET